MENSGMDRLSNLPEHLLLHILSFLPTETAPATSVLSKRWQFLWTLVPNIDFVESRSHQSSVVPSDKGRGFAKFVTKVLFRRRARFIRRFRLKCKPSHDHSDDLDSWVAFALTQNVQELDLDLDLQRSEHIPRSFRFHCTQQSCKTLVVLKLRSVLICGRLDKVSFPLLKIFHLLLPNFVMSYECLPEIKFLPSGFPVLEELVVKKFAYEIFKIEIHLPKLRYLALAINCRGGLVRIDCPALTHLVINDQNNREYRLENLLSLVEATIDLGRQIVIQVTKIEGEVYGRSVMNVVKAISNVRTLRLSYSTMREICIASSYSLLRGDDIPVFHNLVQVELPFVGFAWEILILMLQKFENLECLTLCYQGISRRGVDMELMLQMNVPNCLTSRLTTFSFREFEGTNDEIEVTRYILENSLVLKNVAIHFSSSISSTDRHSIGRKLCKYPRGSEGCELEFLPLEEEDEAVNLKK